MTSRLSIWGKALAAHPVKKEKILSPKTEPASVKTNRGPETPPPRVRAAPETAPPDEGFRKPETHVEHSSVYNTPDAWNRPSAKTRPARQYTASEFPPGRPRMRKDQRRRNTISIALSEQEENMVREAAADRGLSISDWARKAFFRYMGRKPPARDMRRVDWAKGPEIIQDDDE